MTEPGITPDEVRRLRLEPGDTLIVRCSQITPRQAHEYREYLETWFPDNRILVLLADEVAVHPSSAGVDELAERVAAKLADSIKREALTGRR